MAPMAIAALAGLALGAMKGQRNQEKMKEQNQFRKAALAYSPWTGMGDPGSMNLPGMLESGMSGAATGATVGSMFGGGAGAAGAGDAAAAGSAQSAPMMGQQFAGGENPYLRYQYLTQG